MKMSYTMYILIGGCLSIIGAGIAAFASYKSSIKSGEETESIIKTGSSINSKVIELKEKNDLLQNDLDLLNKSSENQLQQIRNLTSLNADLSIQLSNSTLFVSKSITGGDSFCELDFSSKAINSHRRIDVKNHGEYPMHDITVRIIDLEELNLFNKNNPGTPIPGTDIKEITTLPPDFKFEVGTISSSETKKMNYLITLGKFGTKSSFNIFIEAKNGNFSQSLLYYKTNNKWVKASRIKNSKGSTLYEYVDKEFPKRELTWFGVNTN